MQFGTNVNVVCVGNSLMAGYNGSLPIAPNPGNWINAFLRPLIGAVNPINNLAIGGYYWGNMTTDPYRSQVAAAWRSGMINVLIALEDTNNCVGRNTAQNVADARAFAQAVESDHHWDYRIILTCNARWSDTLLYGPNTHQQCSRYTIESGQLYRANPQAYGFTHCCDILQAGSLFVCDYNVFSTFNTAFYSTADTDAQGPVRLHWTQAAQQYVAGVLATTMLGLDSRYKPIGITSGAFQPIGAPTGNYQAIGA